MAYEKVEMMDDHLVVEMVELTDYCKVSIMVVLMVEMMDGGMVEKWG